METAAHLQTVRRFSFLATADTIASLVASPTF
jgi:hypothetical protein